MVPDLIYDVGLNNGDDTAFYLSQGYRVVAIEANPGLVEAARKQFCREIELGRLQILNVGIAETEGVADFWICDDKPVFSSFHRGIASRDSLAHRRIQVPTLRFATVLERYGAPYYLKIDIEGNDALCLADLSPHSLPRFVSLESECPTEGAGSVNDGLRVLAKLRDLGYSRFKLIDQATFCSLSVPRSLGCVLDVVSRRVLLKPPVNRVRGTYRLARRLMVRSKLERKFGREFPLGSSGVWGEDTDGNWMTYAQAERSYLHYRELHFQNPGVPSYSFWCDWHATL